MALNAIDAHLNPMGVLLRFGTEGHILVTKQQNLPLENCSIICISVDSIVLILRKLQSFSFTYQEADHTLYCYSIRSCPTSGAPSDYYWNVF